MVPHNDDVFLTVENGITKYQHVTYQYSASKKIDEEEEEGGEEREVGNL